MLTKKGKYGLKAMVHLAGLAPDELAQVADIARTNSISKKFLDHILTELRHAGLVYSKKGKGGGYALARRASEIPVGAIVRALDGPLAPLPCASVTAFRALRRLRRSRFLPGPAHDGRRAQRDRQRARPLFARRDARPLVRGRPDAHVPHLARGPFVARRIQPARELLPRSPKLCRPIRNTRTL